MIKKILSRIGSIARIRFYYQRSVTDFKKREKISNKIGKRIGRAQFEGDSLLPSADFKTSLAKEGYVDFGKVLDEVQVDRMIEQLKPLNCYDPFRPNLEAFQFDSIPNDVRVANYKRSDLIQIPEILKLANDPVFLNIAQDFLGAKPTISNVNCWWSTSTNLEAEQAQFFHRDSDDYRFCKVFVYLTDVAMENGPHVYVENSASSGTLTKIRRYEDKEIEEEFKKTQIKYFTAPKGSMFMVNTYGFHKGLLPQKGERLLLQIQYSLNPIGIEDYSPVPLKSHDYNSYVNRLIVK